MIDIEITFDHKDVDRRLDEFERLVDSNTSFQERVSSFLHSIVMESFDREVNRETGEVWAPLSGRRIKERGSAHPILNDSGNLKGSVTPVFENNEAAVSTQVGYAKLMQEGGLNAEGSVVPSRPFISMNEADVEHIESMAADFFFSPFA